MTVLAPVVLVEVKLLRVASAPPAQTMTSGFPGTKMHVPAFAIRGATDTDRMTSTPPASALPKSNERFEEGMRLGNSSRLAAFKFFAALRDLLAMIFAPLQKLRLNQKAS